MALKNWTDYKAEPIEEGTKPRFALRQLVAGSIFLVAACILVVSLMAILSPNVSLDKPSPIAYPILPGSRRFDAENLWDRYEKEKTAVINAAGNQVIEVTGEVTEVSLALPKGIYLKFKPRPDAEGFILCGFLSNEPIKNINEGQRVTLAGEWRFDEDYKDFKNIILFSCQLSDEKDARGHP